MSHLHVRDSSQRVSLVWRWFIGSASQGSCQTVDCHIASTLDIYIISKLRKLKYVIYKISAYLTLDAAKKFHFGMIYSVLMYGILIWGASNRSTYYKTLCKLHLKIVSMLFGRHFRADCSIGFILGKMNILRIDDLYRSQVLFAFYKILNTDYLPSMRNFIENLRLTTHIVQGIEISSGGHLQF